MTWKMASCVCGCHLGWAFLNEEDTAAFWGLIVTKLTEREFASSELSDIILLRDEAVRRMTLLRSENDGDSDDDDDEQEHDNDNEDVNEEEQQQRQEEEEDDDDDDNINEENETEEETDSDNSTQEEASERATPDDFHEEHQ